MPLHATKLFHKLESISKTLLESNVGVSQPQQHATQCVMSYALFKMSVLFSQTN